MLQDDEPEDCSGCMCRPVTWEGKCVYFPERLGLTEKPQGV